MEAVGSAVGIASLGIQVCQGLLAYYDSWKSYKTHITTVNNGITNLCETFTLLQESLLHASLDPARAGRVQKCLDSCVDGLEKLQRKLQKLRTHSAPSGARQRAWAEVQRSFYPFRESTLVKLREIVTDLRGQLSLAVQVLQLDCDIVGLQAQTRIEGYTKDTAIRTLGIEDSVAHLSVQTEQLLAGQVLAWLSPPDPYSNHASARRHHEPQTGLWLLQSDQYKRWKAGRCRHLWMYGKAGCGKTILSSTVIEDVRLRCENAQDAVLALFYFSFSDSRKQSYESLLCSLVAQLGWKEPCRSMLQREYDKPDRGLPGPEALEEMLLSSLGKHGDIFLTLDALDECSEDDEARRNMLDFLERLSDRAPNLKIFATSRELQDIRECMNTLNADVLSVSTRPVDADIVRYVSSELSRDRKLNRWDGSTKTIIVDMFAEKADGMFRWAYCQLQELKKLKSTKPKSVKAALTSLPVTLDATYERMLNAIEEACRKEALVLLRWLTYATSPPTLGELAEATIIDPSDAGDVDFDNRGGIEDTLEILSGLIALEVDQRNDADGDKDDESHSEDACSDVTAMVPHINNNTKVRLAHFSVKEYLESKRILHGGAKEFYLDNTKEQGFLAQSCLTYLVHYSNNEQKTRMKDDLVLFPLLEYAARSWFHHSSCQRSEEVAHEVSFLRSEAAMADWLLVHEPDNPWAGSFEERRDTGSGLYYGSLTGLDLVVNALLEAGFDVNAQRGRYGTALQAASSEGHEKVVKTLMDTGADVNAQGGYYGNALYAASQGGHTKVVQMLINTGVADVNAQGGSHGSALQAASNGGYEKVVQMLIDAGADVNAQGGLYSTALYRASCEGHEKVVQILVNAGADMNAQGEDSSNALQAASYRGHEKVVKILIDAGADLDAQGKDYGNALQAASSKGNEGVVQTLIDAGADVNAQGGNYGSALYMASFIGHEQLVQTLIDAGADVNAPGSYYSNAPQAALHRGHEKVVKMLIDAGADVNA